MSSGRLGAYDLTANTPQSLAQGNTDRFTACSVSLCNRNNSSVRVSIAITTTVNNISLLDYIDKDLTLERNGVLERTGIAIKSGQYLTVEADTDNVSAVAWGIASGDPISVTSIPPNGPMVEAVSGGLILPDGVSVLANQYNTSDPALSFDGSAQAVIEKAFDSYLTGDWSWEAIIRPNASIFTPQESQSLFMSVGALTGAVTSRQLAWMTKFQQNSGGTNIIQNGYGDNTDGTGNWSYASQNVSITPGNWLYIKHYFDGTNWPIRVWDYTAGAWVTNQNSPGITAGDYEGITLGRPPFGQVQLPGSSAFQGWAGEVAMFRFKSTSDQIDPAVSGVPNNYDSDDVTPEDIIMYCKQA